MEKTDKEETDVEENETFKKLKLIFKRLNNMAFVTEVFTRKLHIGERQIKFIVGLLNLSKMDRVTYLPVK
ncbi:hypothetical protein CV093_03545 [Oceanobacillus sp. 143]|nr:hypothetical protein CV093_03545 [Oceanobacillus sp. 143]